MSDQQQQIRKNKQRFGRAGDNLVELFERSADRSLDAVAVVAGDVHLTYQAIRERSHRLAQALSAMGIASEDRVGLAFGRSADFPVAALAVLQCGAAFVPIDVTYPSERVRTLLQLASAKLVLTSSAWLDAESLQNCGSRLAEIDEVLDTSGPFSKEMAKNIESNGLAYVIFTSGSTGQPKGVMIEHTACVNTLLDLNRRMNVDAADTLLALSSFSFDLSIYDFFGIFAAGGKVVISTSEDAHRPEHWVSTINSHGVTIWNTAPGLMGLLLNSCAENGAKMPTLRSAWLSGDWIPLGYPEKVAECAPNCSLLSMGGATEVSIWSIHHEVDEVEEDWKSIPYGRSLANQWCVNVDIAGHLCPPQAIGELQISGRGVARGYLDRPALTAERFVPDPYGFGARTYRTGDLCRRHEDGVLELLGRLDGQLKIRGFRVEVGEVEATLAAHPQIRDALIAVDEDALGEKRLLAYYTGKDGRQLPISDIRASLAASLPEYMVPSIFIPIDAMPLTPNGKIDRGALPRPEEDAGNQRNYSAPEGDTERRIAEIWADLLKQERVGRDDNFFDLGGHSLLAMRAVARIRQSTGISLDLPTFFEAATIANIAQLAGSAPSQTKSPIERADRQGALPLSFAQEGMWFLDRFGSGSAYNLVGALRITGGLDVAALNRSLTKLVERHESLRTRFSASKGEVHQQIDDPAPVELVVRNLSTKSAADAEMEAMAILRAEAERPFDLRQGPLFRSSLIRLGSRSHILINGMHHIISDGWSQSILTRELASLYEAFTQGTPSPLPEPELQYADYAIWQRSWLSDEVMAGQLDYWRKRLKGAPPAIDLPVDRKRDSLVEFRGGAVPLCVPLETVAALQTLANRTGATMFMIFLAAFQVVLARWSGQWDVVVGTPTAGRTDERLLDLVGCFINTLALRGDLSGDPSFVEFLAQIRKTTLEAFDHQDVPFDKLVAELEPERAAGRQPVFQTMFVLQNAPESTLALGDLQLEAIDLQRDDAKFDLTLTLQETTNGFEGSIEYASDIFDPATVRRFAGHFVRALDEVARAPDTPLSQLPLLDGIAGSEQLSQAHFDASSPATDLSSGGNQPDGHGQNDSDSNSAEPTTPTQVAIADIWRKVLEIDQVRLDDEFFFIGGNSLLAMTVVAHISDQFEIDMSVRDIFEYPTIEKLAERVLEIIRAELAG